MDVEVQGMIKYSTYTWDLVHSSLSQRPLPPARHQPHLLNPSAQTIKQEETKNHEKRSNPQQIKSFCLCLHKQNPRLREVDLKASAKRGSDKIKT